MPASASCDELLCFLKQTVMGDGMHNLIDGFMIGAAFGYCSNSVAWSIAVSTIAHEFAQEVGDYVTLTLRAGVKPMMALLINFLTGLSVFIGAITALAGDPSDEVRAMIHGLRILATCFIRALCCDCTTCITCSRSCKASFQAITGYAQARCTDDVYYAVCC